MKKFLASIPNRVKAIYLIWATLHFILYVSSGNFLTFDSRKMAWEDVLQYIYPGSYDGTFTFDIKYYDYSDFLLYLIIPILIYFIYYYWKKPNDK